MTSEQLFNFTKKSLRITSTSFDDEISVLLESAKNDISQATDVPFSLIDPVQCNAAAVYVQAHFGSGDDKAEERYQKMLQAIGLRKIKGFVEVISTVGGTP